MLNINEEKWIIVSKDREVIGKGIPRNRYLCRIDDVKDKKRILTYASKAKAESAFIDSWFYSSGKYRPEDMEAIKVNISMQEVQ